MGVGEDWEGSTCCFFCVKNMSEEGTGVTSDVVKVKGEDPATPGPLS